MASCCNLESHKPKSDSNGSGGHSHGNHHDDHVHSGSSSAQRTLKRLILSLILSLPIFLTGEFHFTTGEEPFGKGSFSAATQAIAATVLLIVGGWPFLKGIARELRGRSPGMMTLVAIALIASYSYSLASFFLGGLSFFGEFALLINALLIGQLLEARAFLGCGNAMAAIAALLPQNAHRVLNTGAILDIPIGQIAAGDHLVIMAGERIPADGKITQGESQVDDSLLTGESRPQRKEVGNQVLGGATNLDGVLHITVDKVGEDLFLSQVIEMVRKASASASHYQLMADRLAQWLVMGAMTIAILALISWWALSDRTIGYAVERAVSVLVIACPCALGVAVPLVNSVAAARAAGAGILIRERSAFERLAEIDTVAFDKTGTLTESACAILEVISTKMSSDELLRTMAALEAHSAHPIARAITHAVKGVPPAEKIRPIAGRGVSGVLAGRKFSLVHCSPLEEGLPGALPKNQYATMDAWEKKGGMIVSLFEEEEWQGTVILANSLRKEAPAVVRALQNQKITPYLLTGDRYEIAQEIAAELGITSFAAALRPDDKLEHINSLREEGRSVAMVGDGINDAPALAAAAVGIAMGSGTELALVNADLILVTSELTALLSALEIAKQAKRKASQNLVWAVGYNVLSLPFAAGLLAPIGWELPPPAAALMMTGSALFCAFNARIGWKKAYRNS